jgi:hypothetical protein
MMQELADLSEKQVRWNTSRVGAGGFLRKNPPKLLAQAANAG